MKRTLVWAAVVLLAAALLLAWFGRDAENAPDGVISLTLHSIILGEDRELLVHLPETYDSSAAYPIMYVLDGSSLDYPLTESLRALATEHKVPEVIVVGIPNMNGENREKNLTPPFLLRNNDDPASKPGEADTFMKFLVTELMPFVSQKYPCSQKLFAGNSRGGLLVMYSLIYKPELFDARFCFSTPFWRQNNIMSAKLQPVLESLDTLTTFLYLSAGANETENIRSGMTTMTELFNQHAPAGMDFHADLMPGADHQENAKESAPVAFAKWGEYVKGTKRTKE